MRCEKAQRMLLSGASGENQVLQDTELREHIEQCPECRVLFEKISRLDEMARFSAKPIPEQEPWDIYWTRLSGRLEKRPERKGWMILKQPSLAWGMCAAAVVAACIAFWRTEQKSEQPKNQTAITHVGPLPDDNKHQQVIFANAMELFQNRLEYFATDGRESTFGVASGSDLADAERSPEVKGPAFLSLSLVALSSSGDAKEIAKADLVVMEGKTLEVAFHGIDPDDLSKYTYTCSLQNLEENHLTATIGVQISNPSGLVGAISATTSLKKGHIQELGATRLGQRSVKLLVQPDWHEKSENTKETRT